MSTSEPRIERLRTLARLLDDSIPIPGTRRRIGVDAVIGLIPGVGDAVGSLLSGYIIVEAARMGVPRATLLRMLGNVGIEALVGVVPLLGDVFDAAWKANVRNMRLLNAHRPNSRDIARGNRRFLFGVAAAVVVLVAGFGALAIWLTTALLGALGAV